MSGDAVGGDAVGGDPAGSDLVRRDVASAPVTSGAAAGASARSAPAALTVEHLSIFAGDNRLVDDVSFALAPGQRLGIIGASGSGKTLTCLAAAGLLPAELRAVGSVRLAGMDDNLLLAPERRLASARGRLVGMVFQEPITALNPTMRIAGQLVEGLRVHRSPGGDEGRRARREREHARLGDLLTAVGFDDPERIARSFPHQLSGGQRQRVVLAMAMANRPRVLICDEPTTALDVSVQARVLDLIDDRLADLGSSLVFISHDLAVVAALCDELLVMWQGSIVERGPVVEVLTHPRHEHTRRLLADAHGSVPDGGVDSDTRDAPGRAPDGDPGDAIGGAPRSAGTPGGTGTAPNGSIGGAP